MKFCVKSFVSGVIVASLGITSVFAAGGIQSAEFNSNKVVFNGTAIDMSASPMASVVKEGETDASNYMPLRSVLEAMGYEVSWDGATNTVYINSKDLAAPAAPAEETAAAPSAPAEAAPSAPTEASSVTASSSATVVQGTPAEASQAAEAEGAATGNVAEDLIGYWICEDGSVSVRYYFEEDGTFKSLVDIDRLIKTFYEGTYTVEDDVVTLKYNHRAASSLNNTTTVFTVEFAEDGKSWTAKSDKEEVFVEDTGSTDWTKGIG